MYVCMDGWIGIQANDSHRYFLCVFTRHTTLHTRLRVFSVPRCGVVWDLGGICGLSLLAGLCMAYNDVSDCAVFAMQDCIAVLDLE